MLRLTRRVSKVPAIGRSARFRPRLLFVLVFGLGTVGMLGETSQAAAKQPKAHVTGKVPRKSPAKERAAPPRGKVAVFAFEGDDGAGLVRAQVVRLFRAKGLNVMTSLRPVDSAAQYREMADTLDLAVYVDGEVNGNSNQESVTVRIRSGVTGLRVASATFTADQRKLPAEVGRTLWTQLGAAVTHACADAAKPRKRERTPMRIEAGTPIENKPPEAQGGT